MISRNSKSALLLAAISVLCLAPNAHATNSFTTTDTIFLIGGGGLSHSPGSYAAGGATPDSSLLVDIRVILPTNADPQGGIGEAFVFFDGNITPASNGTGSGSGFSYAYADPYIYIDPSVADASDYTLVLPSDIGNQDPSATATEPASIAMMASGIVKE